jgi:hypothetical protein
MNTMVHSINLRNIVSVVMNVFAIIGPRFLLEWTTPGKQPPVPETNSLLRHCFSQTKYIMKAQKNGQKKRASSYLLTP